MAPMTFTCSTCGKTMTTAGRRSCDRVLFAHRVRSHQSFSCPVVKAAKDEALRQMVRASIEDGGAA